MAQFIQFSTDGLYPGSSMQYVYAFIKNSVNMHPLNLDQFRKDLKRSFLLSAMLCLSVFAFLRIIFFQIPFSFADEGLGLVKNTGVCSVIILVAKTIFNVALHFGRKLQKISRVRWFKAGSGIAVPATLFSLSMMLFACNIPPTGIRKDLNTGMVTKYSGIVPGETGMTMNGEELTHTEIPLGEKFTIINKHIEGLVVKDNKVSIGCSLKISDTKGKEVFYAPDLFKENGLFDKEAAETLKCQVNTGMPMEWEKDYAVTVVFWDKYGKGKIENSLNVTMQDVP